jgi:hypothetical protein
MSSSGGSTRSKRAVTSSLKSSSVLSASSRPSSQVSGKKRTTKTPTTPSVGTTRRKDSKSPSTPNRNESSKQQLLHQDHPTLYRHISLKDERSLILNDDEMISEFEKQKRRYVIRASERSYELLFQF